MKLVSTTPLLEFHASSAALQLRDWNLRTFSHI